MTDLLELTPYNCPVDMDPTLFIAPLSDEDLLDVAVRFDSHQENLEKIIHGEKIAEPEDQVIGHIACGSCAFREECQELVFDASGVVDKEISHPVELRRGMSLQESVTLWSTSIAQRAVDNGYTRHSVANILAGVANLEKPLQALVVQTLEQNPDHIPVKIGKVELPSGKYQLLEFEDVRLLISGRATDELSVHSGTLSTILELFSTQKNGNSLLRESFLTGNIPRALITKLKVAKRVMEFRPAGGGAMRGFGLVIGKINKEDSKDTVLLHSVIHAKGGADATSSEAIRVDGSLSEVNGSIIEACIKEQDDKLKSLKKSNEAAEEKR